MPSSDRIFRLVWLALLVIEATAAVACVLLLPGGFPITHPRFWSNSVAAPCVTVFSFATIWALHRERLAPLRHLLLVRVWIWTAFILTANLLFPVTFPQFLWIAIGGVAIIAIITLTWCTERPGPIRLSFRDLSIALPSLMIGASLVGTQKPPASGVHPYSQLLSAVSDPSSPRHRPTNGSVRLDSRVMVQSSDASLTVHLAPLTLSIQPLLTFLSRSPDGAPTLFVPASLRESNHLEFLDASRPRESVLNLGYHVAGQGSSSLRVESAPEREIQVEALCELRETMFSHLNSFCDFEIRGHSRLSLEFSPCPSIRVDVLPFDYPFGRPARFAFVDSTRQFRVVEATSGEKGPFRDLARGRLELDQPLAITLFDFDQPVARITLDHWSSQADTTLSPTAGWRVPANAIEFSLSSDRPTSPASIFITLAATSVGRGWDCMAHRPGLYRNRMHLISISTPKP